MASFSACMDFDALDETADCIHGFRFGGFIFQQRLKFANVAPIQLPDIGVHFGLWVHRRCVQFPGQRFLAGLKVPQRFGYRSRVTVAFRDEHNAMSDVAFDLCKLFGHLRSTGIVRCIQTFQFIGICLRERINQFVSCKQDLLQSIQNAGLKLDGTNASCVVTGPAFAAR